MHEIDKIDRRILNILQADGRITNLELADRIGLSPTATSERLRRLLKEGYVSGFGARLDPHKLGFGLLVFIEVMLDKTTPEVFDKFAIAIKQASAVLECHMVAGGFDYLIKTRVQDMDEYRRVLGDKIASLRGVRHTQTYFVLEEVKSTHALPIRGGDSPTRAKRRRRSL
jgi:Lrp/AsnC family leucine-responsive transcriptional regulator